MSLGVHRLRLGELIAGSSGALLLASLLLLTWYDSATGWRELTHLRWLSLLVALAAILLLVLQTERRAPALPVTLSVIVTVLGLLNLLWLGYRVLISMPPHQKLGAYLGLLWALGIFAGGWRSVRQEGVSSLDEVSEVERVELKPSSS